LTEIIAEVRRLVASGYKEIVLTGVNVGDYADGAQTLCDLVRAVDAVSGVQRLRLSSINPNEVSDALLDAIGSGRSCCHSMHLVLQSGSDNVLALMRRQYTKGQYAEVVAKLKERCPDATFTTDVIVGFPGETDANFQETMDMVKSVRYAKVHIFPYSDRPQTLAARSTAKVPHDVIKARKTQLFELAEAVAFDLRHSFLGQEKEVLTERGEVGEYIQGQTMNGLPVLISRGSLQHNQQVRVRLDKNTSCGLVGTIVEVLP
jgi:threonylcarbamoyladenosine tRNA methylthiotransferase MtaB